MKRPPPSEAAFFQGRCLALDAWRGLVMCLMMGEALQFCAVSAALPGNSFWKFLCYEQSHAPWAGCRLHDLIQPSFSFLVGAVLPFSLAKRIASGQTRLQLFRHAVLRALILIFLGIALDSINTGYLEWRFENTLTQIGLAYVLLFVIAFRPLREQWASFALILFGYWLAFAIYPVGAHWDKNKNLAWAFDTWFLNLFPRRAPFFKNPGGYETLSFIPTLATMILGLIAGEKLRDDNSRPAMKLRWFMIAAGIGLGIGWILDLTGICPVVKRIWTPAWVLFSGGWCFVFLSVVYYVTEMRGRRRWTFPLVVLGANSIAAYCIANSGDVLERLFEHCGSATVFHAAANPYAPLWQGAAALAGVWLILYALYRKRIFIRI